MDVTNADEPFFQAFMGQYQVQPGMEESGRPVYKHENNNTYLYFAGSSWWLSFNLGENAGWYYTYDAAPTADQITDGWMNFANGESWQSDLLLANDCHSPATKGTRAQRQTLSNETRSGTHNNIFA
jgi:hypothetical protein